MNDKIKCGITGALAGAANGIFGAGGGMIIIPLLVRWVKLEERKAFASSICIVLPMCIVSASVYIFRGSVDLMQALPYLIGGLIGGAIGGLLYKKVPMCYLRKILGLIIIYGGIKIIMR